MNAFVGSRRALLGGKPRWLLAGNPSAQLDFGGGHVWLNGHSYQGDAAFKSLFNTFSTPSCYVTDSAGNLHLAPANSIHGFYGSDRGQLIEEARTNLVLYSNTFSNAAWTKGFCSVTAAATTGPDGLASGWRLTEDGTTNPHRIYQSCSTAAGATTTIYAIAKADTRTWLKITGTQFSSGANPGVWYDLANGVLGTVGAGATASISPLSGGWYICVYTAVADTASSGIFIQMAAGNNGNAYIGDSSSGLYLWGVQVETDAFATSFIPTTSATVTRAASSIIATDGSPLATVAQSAKSMFFKTYGIKGGTAPNLIGFAGTAAVNYNSSTVIRATNGTNNADATIGASGTYAGVVNSAFGMDGASFTAVANGGTQATSANTWAGNTGDVTLSGTNGYRTTIALHTTNKGAFDSLAVVP